MAFSGAPSVLFGVRRGGGMSYWLAKSDPGTYGWSDLVRDGKTSWDGVRNYKARNYIRAMKPGDLALFYHSGEEKSVVGAMKILSEAYTDPTAEEDIWSAVDVGPVWMLKSPVPLSRIKAEPSLRNIHLVRVARLSVMPLEKEEFQIIVSLGGGTRKV
jgi:predicted RNA-binding protein with PUA-like domain